MSNIMRIYPYKQRGPLMGRLANLVGISVPYVFDDPAKDLYAEPFVGGASEVLDLLAYSAGIQRPDKGVAVAFSDEPFSYYSQALDLVGPHGDGHDYLHRPSGMVGYLCPALLKYFDAPPARIYLAVMHDPLRGQRPRPKRPPFEGHPLLVNP